MNTRIAIVRQSYRHDGGAERSVASLIEALGRSNFEITLIARHWSGEIGSNAKVRLVRRNPFYLGRLWRESGFARSVQEEIASSDYGLVQSNERISGCDLVRVGDGIHREWLSQKARVQSPIARWFSSIRAHHLYTLRAERKALQDPDLKAIVCNSSMVRDEIVRHFDVNPRKLHVIYNGVDTEHFCPDVSSHRAAMREELGIYDSAPVFLLVGSGLERKGVGVAIEAIAPFSNAHLVVVGKAKRRKRYDNLGDQLRCARRVHFCGTTEDVRPYYGMADALILPSLYDPFPNVIFEAMACGLPVVTSQQCGGTDLIEEGQNGFVCDALDVSGFQRAVRHLSGAHTAEVMGQRARRTVEPYTHERMQAEMVDLYQSLLKTPAKPVRSAAA